MQPHPCRVSIFSECFGLVNLEGVQITLRQKCRGEKRTGPALNPLKGSSARLPHLPKNCNLAATTTSLFSIHSKLFPGKKALLPPKNYLPTGAFLALVR